MGCSIFQAFSRLCSPRTQTENPSTKQLELQTAWVKGTVVQLAISPYRTRAGETRTMICNQGCLGVAKQHCTLEFGACTGCSDLVYPL